LSSCLIFRRLETTVSASTKSIEGDALKIFKSANALIIDTLDDLGTGDDRNAKQLKLALRDFGFMVALVVTECVLQYSLALSNLLQRPSIDLIEAASEAETVISSLRKIRQDDNVCQELYQDITKLAEKQNVLPSKPRTAGRQQNRDNVPADTPEEYWRRSVYYPLLDHIANELETRLVVPKDGFWLNTSSLQNLPPLHPKENFRFVCHLQVTCPITILQHMKQKW
jgi:hypothetical protein